jgi:hypothetical protein
MAQRYRKTDRKSGRGLEPRGERLDSRVLLTGVTAVVVTTLDVPVIGGTLRDAILAVDASTSTANTIIFNIPKSDPGYNPSTGTFAISPQSELPQITSPVLIDGTSESTFLGEPALVVIDGNEIKGTADGLTVASSAPGSTIIDLEILGFDDSGILIESLGNTIGGTASDDGNILVSNSTAGVTIAPNSGIPGQGSDNLLVGNLIGTNPKGDSLGNGVGVIVGTSSNTIGGSTPGAANVIGSNDSDGIEITAGASDNLVLGNFIGTNASGANLNNSVGVAIDGAGNTIGGTATNAGNTIGFNTAAGVEIGGRGEIDDLVLGNFIGTNLGGANVGNAVGVLINSGSNTIGGTAVGAANVFGFNTTAGVLIAGTGSTANVVLGNLIGTDAGYASLGNEVGVIVSSPSNTIGGSTSGAGNVIGFNDLEGIQITAGAIDNLVLGNFIGVGPTSVTTHPPGGGTVTTSSFANLGNPIGLSLESASNTIGGTSAGAANVFGSNTMEGLLISGTGAIDNLVLGNLIGTGIASSTFYSMSDTGIVISISSYSLVNLASPIGVSLETASNTIGGSSAGAGNLFGFNTTAGLLISGTGATSEAVLGNFFGTSSNDPSYSPMDADLANAIGVLDDVGGNSIGGSSAGATNVFGFNSTAGLQIAGTNDLVIGNLFGINAGGANVGNTIGISVSGGGNTIGGTTSSSANIIGFNRSAGVSITGTGATGNVLLGNFIGTNSSDANLSNTIGVVVGSGDNTIGGTASAARNVISQNGTAGVQIIGAGASGNVLLGNSIGTDRSGQIALGNGIGVLVNGGIGNDIGAAGAVNVISGNLDDGIEITGTGANGNVLLGNYIGTDYSGTVALGNVIGVLVTGGTANVIGGTTTVPANVISGNLTAGIELAGGLVSGTQIAGNFIGTDPTGTLTVERMTEIDPLQARQNVGILINSSVGNTVGGAGNAFNVISGNYVGVNLANTTGPGSPNLVVGNLIGTDASGTSALGNIVGIYINGAMGNQIGAPGLPNTISGNSSVGVEIYGLESKHNVVEGNTIGLAEDGNTALRNGQVVQPTGVFILNASHNTIGGPDRKDGNTISGNQNAGVYIFSQAGVSKNNMVEGNLIGLPSGGVAGPGNDGYGVLFLDSPNNKVRLSGSAANLFGRNRIANFRSLTGPAAAVPVTAAKGQAVDDVSTHRAHRRSVLRAEPARPETRKTRRGT